MKRRSVIGVLTLALLGALLAAGYAAYGSDLLPAEQAENVQPATPSPAQPTPTAEAPVLKRTSLLAPGDATERVRELQARLRQIGWYDEPKITGRYDDTTRKAVMGFQAKRGVERTGSVDRGTWQLLIDMTTKPTHAEMHNKLVAGPTIIGPGDTGKDVRDLQARLKQIAWYYELVTGTYGDATTTAVSGFQAKRGVPATGEVDQRTWDLLLGMTRTPTDDELYNRYPTDGAGPLDPRCEVGRVLCIDKSTNNLRWVVDGQVLMSFDVRFGSELTPTREGQFSVYYKSRDHVSSIYDTPMPFAMFFSGGQAVHYSPDFASNGYNGASHGCVNVRDYDGIASLFDQVNNGDTVIVYWS